MSIAQLFLNLGLFTLESKGLNFAESTSLFQPLYQLWYLDFDETGLIVKELIESKYTSGITGLEQVNVIGNDIVGIFVDATNPLKPMRFKFKITPTKISYTTLDSKQSANYTEFAEYLDFAAKPKTPKIGEKTDPDKLGRVKTCTDQKSFACGATCRPWGTNCSDNLRVSLREKQKEVVARFKADATSKKGKAKATLETTPKVPAETPEKRLTVTKPTNIKSLVQKSTTRRDMVAINNAIESIKSREAAKSVLEATDGSKTAPVKFTIDKGEIDDETGASETIDTIRFNSRADSKPIEFKVADREIKNTRNVLSIQLSGTNTLVRVRHPQNYFLGDTSSVGRQRTRNGDDRILETLDDLAESLVNAQDYSLIKVSEKKKFAKEDSDDLLGYLSTRLKEGDLVAITSEDTKTFEKMADHSSLTYYPPKKEGASRINNNEDKPLDALVLLGRVSKGKLIPVDYKEIENAIQLSRESRNARLTQFAVGVDALSNNLFRDPSEDIFKNEDNWANKADALEDKWVGRKPKSGIVKPKAEYEKKAEAWAKSMGFSGGANGYSVEATKAHDIAHPVTHEMLGMDSKAIHKSLGSVLTSDGKPSLAAEEAIVNVVEHLSRGDSFEASITNGMRLARVIARAGADKEGTEYLRSNEFKSKLEDLTRKIFTNDNYNEYMKLVREANRIAGTVRSSGNNFTSTASGG